MFTQFIIKRASIFTAFCLVVSGICIAADTCAPASLGVAFKDHFSVGTAIKRSHATGHSAGRRSLQQVEQEIALIKEQFNQITSENDMKWEHIHPHEGADGYLEPNEGQFNWAVIDDLIAKWTAHGLGISFRISCKETGTDRVEQQYAAPRWVMAAGAKGGHFRSGKVAGPDAPWEPVFDDPNLNLDSQNRRWLPLPQGDTHTARYVLDIPKTTRPGRYALKLKLHSPGAQRDVFLALSPKLLDNENFYNLGMIEIAE